MMHSAIPIPKTATVPDELSDRVVELTDTAHQIETLAELIGMLAEKLEESVKRWSGPIQVRHPECQQIIALSRILEKDGELIWKTLYEFDNARNAT